jgi:hypothetical protein
LLRREDLPESRSGVQLLGQFRTPQGSGSLRSPLRGLDPLPEQVAPVGATRISSGFG